MSSIVTVYVTSWMYAFFAQLVCASANVIWLRTTLAFSISPLSVLSASMHLSNDAKPWSATMDPMLSNCSSVYTSLPALISFSYLSILLDCALLLASSSPSIASANALTSQLFSSTDYLGKILTKMPRSGPVNFLPCLSLSIKIKWLAMKSFGRLNRSLSCPVLVFGSWHILDSKAILRVGLDMTGINCISAAQSKCSDGFLSFQTRDAWAFLP